MSFDTLYGENCAGCHGTDGQNGPATDLANPEYEALIDDASSARCDCEWTRRGQLMPGFDKRCRGRT